MTDRYQSIQTGRTREVDEGLRGYMNGIYARMAAGVLVTAIMAFAIGTTPALFKLLMGGPQAYLFAFAPALVTFFGFRPDRMNEGQLQGSFFLISALYGVSFSTIAVMVSAQPALIYDVARAFMITVSMFAALSIFGYTTKKDLSGMGQFIFMAVIGLFAMSILNMFIQSSGFSLIISLISIVVFAGLTVFETQQLKQMYLASRGHSSLGRMAWCGALTLYISFIAMFMNILQLLMGRSSE